MNEPLVTVIGNIGSEVELKTTGTGKSVTSFSLGNTPRVKVDGEWADGETTWFRVTLWNRDAESAAQNLHKGAKVLVTGRLVTKSYTDKEGAERKSLEITADGFGIVPKANSALGDVNAEDIPWG